jgi:Chaperone of endosialidase
MERGKERKNMNSLLQPKSTPPLLISLTLLCFALLPKVEAVVPPPDGGYPGANTAEGQQALLSLSGGTFNTALGWSSLKSNIAGNYNTGVGAGALVLNTSDQNTATGAGALLLNTSGFRNTANGAFALLHNNAADNTGIGNAALFTNTTGSGNTAIGNFALIDNDTGSNNTAVGNGALAINAGANDNTAIGAGALGNGTTSGGNTAIGSGALANNTFLGGFNTAVGAGALSNNSGVANIAVGATAGGNVTSANGVICIGAAGADVSLSTWIGNIYNTTTVSGTTQSVIVSDTGQLGTMSSSRRFKKDIQPMDKVSEAILALKPVTFHYKSDARGIAQFGLVAEEVEKVSPDLVIREPDGKPYTVRYEAVNAMLLNEFLKEHRTVQEQKATIAQLEKGMKTVIARLEEQASQIQKVSAQIKAGKAVERMASTNP